MSEHTNKWIGLDGRVCVITGATGGIGRATAEAFADVGAKVVAIDRDQKLLDELAAELSGTGAAVMPAECDISDPDMVSEVARRSLERLGPCNVLVNCAGMLRAGPLADLSPDGWEASFRVNFGGALYMSQQFGRQMMEHNGGALVHIASISGLFPTPHSGAYSASKAALSALSKQLAVEWAPHRIRSNTVCPGLIRTPLTEQYYKDDELRRRRDEMVPVGRVGDGSDIADVAVFLASHRARYITGQDIVVDGGLTQTLWSTIPRPAK